MLAAEEPAAVFQPVAHDMCAAMRAGRRQGSDRTFEAVEKMGLPLHDYLKGLVIVVSARLANRHNVTSQLVWALSVVELLRAPKTMQIDLNQCRPSVLSGSK